MLITSTRLMR